MLPPLATDMDIGTPVVLFLREQGIDVVSGREESWHYLSDSQILALAHSDGRFVLTHDSDFGKLAVLRKESFTGIIYLRPGGRPPNLVIADLQKIIVASYRLDTSIARSLSFWSAQAQKIS